MLKKGKKTYKLSIYFIVLLMLINSVIAFDFQVKSVTQPPSKPYQGDTSTLTATLASDPDNVCHLRCVWSNGQYGPKTISTDIAPGQNKIFGFEMDALGSKGVASSSLVVNCGGVNALDCWGFMLSSKTYIYSINLYFYYNGDGTCTTSKENCATASSDCRCSSDKECKPNSPRGSDSKGCATFCGNSIVEKPYETCSNCPDDVGKCEGESCYSASECEDKYCARGRCSKLPYLIGDGLCDSDVGENCKNSVSDCSCNSFERCSSAGICETFCGNGICESKEQGICKSDCDWCGDGECNQNENCQKCSEDCGVCETLPEEQITEVKEIITQQKQQLTKTNKIIFASVGGALLLLVVAWFLYKFLKEKRPKTEKKETKQKELKCPKCKKKLDKKTKFCPSCGHNLK